MVGLLILAQSLHPHSSATDPGGALWCYALCSPLWLISMWYWWNHYYVRYGRFTALIAGGMAFIFSAVAALAMIGDFALRSLTGNTLEVGPCPQCGSLKIRHEKPDQLPHQSQPICPHCQQRVFEAPPQ